VHDHVRALGGTERQFLVRDVPDDELDGAVGTNGAGVFGALLHEVRRRGEVVAVPDRQVVHDADAVAALLFEGLDQGRPYKPAAAGDEPVHATSSSVRNDLAYISTRPP
jgi:hypothetical protein